jgi:Raf kinase inhibitor-like YbhB/YbcL family protein
VKAIEKKDKIMHYVVVFAFMCGGTSMAQHFMLTSDSFQHNSQLSNEYAYKGCHGQNRSPHLVWQGAPTGTKSFALIVEDPDAPRAQPFIHWIIYDIPATVTMLPAGLGEKKYKQGVNDFGTMRYDGPCPPKGHGVHRYYFKIYALDTVLTMSNGITKEQFDTAVQGHILATAEIIGLYER